MTAVLHVLGAVWCLSVLAFLGWLLWDSTVPPWRQRRADVARVRGWLDEPRPEFTDECKRLVSDELARRRDGRVQS